MKQRKINIEELQATIDDEDCSIGEMHLITIPRGATAMFASQYPYKAVVNRSQPFRVLDHHLVFLAKIYNEAYIVAPMNEAVF